MIAASAILSQACTSGIGRVSDTLWLLRAAVQLSMSRSGGGGGGNLIELEDGTGNITLEAGGGSIELE